MYCLPHSTCRRLGKREYGVPAVRRIRVHILYSDVVRTAITSLCMRTCYSSADCSYTGTCTTVAHIEVGASNRRIVCRHKTVTELDSLHSYSEYSKSSYYSFVNDAILQAPCSSVYLGFFCKWRLCLSSDFKTNCSSNSSSCY